MKKRSAHPVALAAVLTLVPVSLGAFWWLNRSHLADKAAEQTVAENLAQPANSPTLYNIDTRKADGRSGQSILGKQVSEEKQKGLDALAAQNYDRAQSELAAVIQTQYNDPESLIYLNNAEVGEAESYTIAASMPISEVLAPSLELMRGVSQAQEQVNAAGGINGVPLKVLLFDDAGDSDKAKAIAAALVADKSVLGVVGHYASDTSLDAAPVYEAGGLTMISPISTAVKFEDAGDYIFRTVPSDALAAKTLALDAFDTGKRQVAVFYTRQSTYSKSIQTEFITAFEENGGSIVTEFDISEASFDAATAVESAIEQNADLLMLALTIDTAETSVDIIQANQRRLPLVGGDDLYDPKILEDGQMEALGLVVAVPWHIRNHRDSAFVKKAQRLWRGDVNWRTVTAYDAAISLVEAIEASTEVTSTEETPTREDVATALAQTGFSAQGATSEVTFSPKGDRDQPSQLVEIVEGNRSGTGYDYEPKD
ncbi:MAG: ABC transporter substrate-binding protein [Cyanobacteria bacterium J06597_16]